MFAFAAFAVLVSDPFATIFRSRRLLFFGDFLFTGEPCFQKNKDGTAVGFKLFLRPVSDVRWSLDLNPRMIGHSKLFANISSYGDYPFPEQFSVFRELMERYFNAILFVNFFLTPGNTTVLRHISDYTTTCKHWIVALDASLSCYSTQIVWGSRHFGIRCMVFCVARNCTNNSKSKVSSFKFPQDPNLWREWLIKTKRAHRSGVSVCMFEI